MKNGIDKESLFCQYWFMQDTGGEQPRPPIQPPQGNEQQNMSPELKLSRELWTTCENLLQERGKTLFSVPAFLNLVLKANIGYLANLHIPGIERRTVVFDQLINQTASLRSLMTRRVRVEGKEEGSITPSIITVCGELNAVFPGLPPYYVDVYISPTNNKSEVNIEFLRLRKDRRPEIMKPQEDKSHLIRRCRWATVEDLTYYQKAINQSSPIEHK